MRIGQGWDRHRLTKGDHIILGGIRVQSDFKSVAHSDGDVLIHAIIDALLGACALGDIGRHFPPSDSKYKNIESSKLLNQTKTLLDNQSFKIINIDSTIILENPKLSPYIESIRDSLSSILEIDKSLVSVKAKTAEKCDAVGRGEAIEAMAVVLVENKH